MKPDSPESSPRPWGCFRSAEDLASHGLVFPTPVGVFPRPRPTPMDRSGLPHARGGVSAQQAHQAIQTASSPRPWGCFLRRDVAHRI